jgi:hypothetical protein
MKKLLLLAAALAAATSVHARNEEKAGSAVADPGADL